MLTDSRIATIFKILRVIQTLTSNKPWRYSVTVGKKVVSVDVSTITKLPT